MIAPFSLVGVTVAAALGFTRVFAEPTEAIAAAVAGGAAHAALLLARSRQWGPGATAGATVAAGTVAVVWAVLPDTTAWGVPTAATLGELGSRIEEGLTQVRVARIPVEPGTGLVVVVALGIWLAAVTADWVAVQARAVLAALLPSATLFTLSSAIGDGEHAGALAGGYVAAALLFVLTQAPASARGTHAWFGREGKRQGSAAALRIGLPVVVVAALAAPVLGPRLPEAESAGLVDLGPGGGPRTRVTVSPLVDIRRNLTRSPPVEVFRVRPTAPAYWRLAALETFDGDIWSSLAEYRTADDLPADSDVAPTARVVQDFQISNLAQFWLPAAYRPASIDLDGARVNPDSLTLLTEEETAAGLTYQVVSEVPQYTPLDFAAQTGALPDRVRPMLDLPGGVPRPVVDLAREVTAGSTTPYEQARALQNFFRTQFRYDETVPAGHSDDRMVDFLLHGRAGYCEQFSSSFAVMARALGIPARVAVGFTPGTPTGDGTYVVTSAEAHAWPEVYIDPLGWVAFEPTPGRSDPSPGNHTGTFDPAAQPGVGTRTTAVPDTSVPSDPATDPAASEPETGLGTPPGPPAGEGGDGGPGALAGLAALATVVASGGLWWRLHRARVRRRHRLASLGARDAVLFAWNDLVERLEAEGFHLRPSLTPREVARLVADRDPRLAEPVERLRHHVERAAWSPHEPETPVVAAARSDARAATSLLDAHETAGVRLRRELLGR